MLNYCFTENQKETFPADLFSSWECSSIWHSFLWICRFICTLWEHTVGKCVAVVGLNSASTFRSFLCCPPSRFIPTFGALPFRRAEDRGIRVGGGAVCVCVSASRMREERSAGEVCTGGGCMWRGASLRCCREVERSGEGGYHCSSMNNMNVKWAGGRRFENKERLRDRR